MNSKEMRKIELLQYHPEVDFVRAWIGQESLGNTDYRILRSRFHVIEPSENKRLWSWSWNASSRWYQTPPHYNRSKNKYYRWSWSWSWSFVEHPWLTKLFLYNLLRLILSVDSLLTKKKKHRRCFLFAGSQWKWINFSACFRKPGDWSWKMENRLVRDGPSC